MEKGLDLDFIFIYLKLKNLYIDKKIHFNSINVNFEKAVYKYCISKMFNITGI